MSREEFEKWVKSVEGTGWTAIDAYFAGKKVGAEARGEQIAARLRERANEIAGTFDDYALITAELRSLADEIAKGGDAQ